MIKLICIVALYLIFLFSMTAIGYMIATMFPNLFPVFFAMVVAGSLIVINSFKQRSIRFR